MARSRAIKHLVYLAALLFFLTLSIQGHAQDEKHAPGASPAPRPVILQHQLQVELIPGLKMLKVTDHIHFPKNFPHKTTFLLHKNLQIQTVDRKSQVLLLSPGNKTSPFNEWGLDLEAADLTITYNGPLDTPIVDDESDGAITSDGAALFNSTYWYPAFSGSLQTFQLTVSSPANWITVTQGQQVSRDISHGQNITQWSEIYPQESIYLVAGPFFEFTKTLPSGKNIRVLLRKEDKALADSFLNTIPDYISHYTQEIGRYPYADFSVVENFWETGYGMPAFTLLGPTVIRLPFLLTSSLPHEILHNWWGNSVYIAEGGGNWTEGLTTYMADHWQQEVVRNDAEYRRQSLVSYQNYVKTAQDFPVREFKRRLSESTQAVGYGKSMMFFHMLKKQVGADLFNKSLQDFYSTFVFNFASFKDIQKSFEKIFAKSLETEFAQWLDRTGAPTLELTSGKVLPLADGNFKLQVVLSQTQTERYLLPVPIRITLNNNQVIETTWTLKEAKQTFNLTTPAAAARIEVDPNYDIFRTLYPEESPVTLSAVLGADQVSFYYPQAQKVRSLEFVTAWQKSLQGKTEVHEVDETLSLNGQGALVLVGEDNRFLQFMKTQLQGHDFDVSETLLHVDGSSYSYGNHSWLIVARNRSNPAQAIVWVRPAANMDTADWAHRLTHYGTFSVLVFEDQPNIKKMTWPVINSPLRQDL